MRVKGSMRRAMSPSFVSTKSREFGISLDEETVKKISGGNAKLRSVVEKISGKIEEEGERIKYASSSKTW